MRSLGAGFAQDRREAARAGRRIVTPEGSCGGKRGVLDQHDPFVRSIYAHFCHTGRGQPVQPLMGMDEIVMNYRQLDARRVILL